MIDQSQYNCQCPVCYNDNYSSGILLGNYHVSFCDYCGLGITNSYQGKRNQINRQFYTKEYLERYINRYDYLKQRYRDRIQLIDVYTYGGNFLDIGCGPGLFIQSLIEDSSHKWRGFGVDINKLSIQYAKDRLPGCSFQIQSVKKLKFNSNYFHCVTCFDVLEHDLFINKNLSEIFRVLVPGGILVIQVPNYKSLMAMICNKYWDWWSVPDHVLHFSHRSLKLLFRKYPEVELINHFSWDPKSEFIANITGSIRMRLSKAFYFNKLISKIIALSLTAFWPLISIVSSYSHKGALSVIILKKAK